MADPTQAVPGQVPPEPATPPIPTPSEPAAAATEQDEATILGGTEGDESGAENADDGKKAEDEGAPEEYADFTLPEGFELDDATKASFKQLAKQHNLSQSAAQGLIDLHTQVVTAALDESRKVVAAWAEEVRADKDLGGANYDSTLADVKRAMGRFGTPALRELLNSSGLGNHPEVVRFVAAVGKSFKEDSVVPTHGQPAPTGEEAVLRTLYPNSYDDMVKTKSS